MHKSVYQLFLLKGLDFIKFGGFGGSPMLHTRTSEVYSVRVINF